MLHKTRNLTCLIFANGVSHFSKRYQISPNWKISNENDLLGDGANRITEPIAERAFHLRPHRETASHPEPQFQNTLSAETPSGNCIPFSDLIPECTFRQAPQPESPSHSKAKFRDTLSETPPIRKTHPTLGTLGHGIISPTRLPRLRPRALFWSQSSCRCSRPIHRTPQQPSECWRRSSRFPG